MLSLSIAYSTISHLAEQIDMSIFLLFPEMQHVNVKNVKRIGSGKNSFITSLQFICNNDDQFNQKSRIPLQSPQRSASFGTWGIILNLQ